MGEAKRDVWYRHPLKVYPTRVPYLSPACGEFEDFPSMLLQTGLLLGIVRGDI